MAFDGIGRRGSRIVTDHPLLIVAQHANANRNLGTAPEGAGAAAGLCRMRDRARGRRARSRATAAPMAGRWLPWRDAMDGGARGAARLAKRAVARSTQRHHAGDELCSGPRPAGAGGGRDTWTHFRLRTGARLS